MQITTEITSSQIPSDNPIHQRLLYAYIVAKQYIKGRVAELGCGEGRGLATIAESCNTYTALDKNKYLLDKLALEYPKFSFIESTFPPFSAFDSDSFDTAIAFQVIEHIQDDELFVKEIHRVLATGGKAIISTPNIDLSLTRNPWHIREYKPKQLEELLKKHFSKVTPMGITGNAKVWEYFELNRQSVSKYAKWDIFNLQYKLPASLLRIPYDFLNRRNRNKMLSEDNSLVASITTEDYSLTEKLQDSFDLFYIAEK